MRTEERFENLKRRIDEALAGYLPKGEDILKKVMRYSVLSGGKRIRPIIAIESSRLCGARFKDVIPVACAIEFIHTYSLIHDDLPSMDDDDLRRGKPSCHRAFGEANAILAGDSLLTMAFNIIAKNTGPDIGLDIIKDVSDAAGIDGMVGGQALDIEFQKKKKNKKVLNRINLLKTAKLFKVSAKAGALSARAGRKEMTALEKFGLYFGMAFQSVDDYLDGEGEGLKEAAILIGKAKKELDMFGKSAKDLRELSDLILERKK